ncbi:hypothetical protein [Agromyces sp. SYSU T00266]|uniref:hypothetical protein n=1 Tax=Agromyces zhanjiangensis TaxID=3158562 RepID=UPI003397FFEA
MTELLHAGMVIPASLGVCCSVGVGAWSAPSAGSAGRRRARAAAAVGRLLPVMAALLMLGAMLDMAFGSALVPGWTGRSVGWAAAMVLTALLVVASGRVAGRVGHVDLHRALGLVVTAGLVAAAHPAHAQVAPAAASAHSAHAGSALLPAVLAAAVAFAGFSAWSAVSTWRGAHEPAARGPRGAVAARLRSADAAGMAVMSLAMAAMLLA